MVHFDRSLPYQASVRIPLLALSLTRDWIYIGMVIQRSLNPDMGVRKKDAFGSTTNSYDDDPQNPRPTILMIL